MTRRRELRSRCRELLAQIGIGPGFTHRATAAEVRADLERLRGRPVHLIPVRTQPGSPTGMWIATALADYIFHVDPAQTSLVHATHCILHEAGHMMLEHTGTSGLGMGLSDNHRLPIDPTAPVMLRSRFSDACERDAEVFATLACGYLGDVRAATRLRDNSAAGQLSARLLSTLSDTPLGPAD